MEIARFDKGFGSKVTVFDSRVVSGERSYYSDPIRIGGEGNFGVWLKATSAIGSPKIRNWYEMSYDDDEDNFVIPKNVGDIISNWSGERSGEVALIESISPPLMPFIRFGVTGLSGNPNDTILTEVIINT